MSLPASAFANVPTMRPVRKSAAQLKASARIQQDEQARLKRKIDQAARVLDRHEARAAGLAREIKRLQKLKAVTEARCERVEDRILMEMAQAGLNSVTGIRVTLTARPAPASLVITDETALPPQYINEKLVLTPDKNAIKLAIAQGADIPGAHVVQKISLIRK